MHILIVDDETTARANLITIFREYCPEVGNMEEAASAGEALEKISVSKPDALFLDIQMPGTNGLELAETLNGLDLPIVFVTAYDHYAIRALRASAVDYLLKPVKIAELRHTIEKLEKRTHKRQESSGLSAIEILSNNLKEQHTPSRLKLPWEGGFKVLNVRDIIHIKSDNAYSEVNLTSGSLVVSMSIGEFEEILGEKDFFRVHNSYLINLDRLDSYSNKSGGQIIMKDGSIIPVSRRRHTDFKEIADVYLNSK